MSVSQFIVIKRVITPSELQELIAFGKAVIKPTRLEQWRFDWLESRIAALRERK